MTCIVVHYEQGKQDQLILFAYVLDEEVCSRLYFKFKVQIDQKN